MINRAPGPNSGYHWLYDLSDDAQFDKGEERDVLRQENIIKRTTRLDLISCEKFTIFKNLENNNLLIDLKEKTISLENFTKCYLKKSENWHKNCEFSKFLAYLA